MLSFNVSCYTSSVSQSQIFLWLSSNVSSAAHLCQEEQNSEVWWPVGKSHRTESPAGPLTSNLNLWQKWPKASQISVGFLFVCLFVFRCMNVISSLFSEFSFPLWLHPETWSYSNHRTLDQKRTSQADESVWAWSSLRGLHRDAVSPVMLNSLFLEATTHPTLPALIVRSIPVCFHWNIFLNCHQVSGHPCSFIGGIVTWF